MAPLLHQQNIRSSFMTLYFYCFVCYTFFLERLYFRCQFYFVFFSAINGWTPTYFFWRRHTPFSLPRTLYFSLLSFNECSFFLVAFVFCLDFFQNLLVLYS
jgi:hypothetical protein